jgi:transposase
LKVGKVTPKAFEERIRELAAFDAFVAEVVEPMLIARNAMRRQYDELHGILLRVVKDDPVCRRLMTMPGVGAVVAMNFRLRSTCHRASADPVPLGAPRPHSEAIPIWRSRLDWPNIQSGRRHDARLAV